MHVVDCCNITIGKHTFTRVSEVTIDNSSEEVQDTATIVLPTSARLVNTQQRIASIYESKIFKVGDAVTIKLGYNDDLHTEFEGFVKRIIPSTALEIQCEDRIYLLRKKNLRKAWKSVRLAEVLAYIVEGTGITLDNDNIPDMQFTAYYLRDVNGAMALQQLKEDYGFIIYLLPNNVLHVGITSDASRSVVKYQFAGDDNNVIESELKQKDSSDVQLRVKAINIAKNGSRTEVEVGDEGGELRNLHFYNIATESELKSLAAAKLELLRSSSFVGDITTFLVPRVRAGYIASYNDDMYKDRSSSYLVERVKTTFGTSGARRTLSMAVKLGV